MHIKTTVKYYFALIRMKEKKNKITSVDEDVEKLEPTAGGIMK